MHIVWSYILNLIVLIFLLNQSGSPPVRCFISWKAPEDRCYSATRGEVFILKFTKYRLVAGLRPDPLGEGRGVKGRGNTNFAPQPKNRSRAYATDKRAYVQNDDTAQNQSKNMRMNKISIAHEQFQGIWLKMRSERIKMTSWWYKIVTHIQR